MDDIAKLLRSRPLYESHGEESDLPEMAADEIERLRGEIAAIREHMPRGALDYFDAQRREGRDDG